MTAVAARHVPSAAARGQRYAVRCDADRWEFDPRYTDGRCPICGHLVEIAPAAPRWLLVSRRVPWDLVFLAVLMVAFSIAGYEAARAAGMLPPHHWRGITV